MMQERLQEALAEAEAKKGQIVRLVMAVPESDRGKPVKEGDWGPAQVLDHLLKVEEILLAGHRKVVEERIRQRPSLKGKIFVSMLGLMIPARIRVPSMPAFEPSTQVYVDQRIKDWAEVRAIFASELGNVTASGLRDTFAIHPVAGFLSAEPMLRLMSLHIDYHLHFFPQR